MSTSQYIQYPRVIPPGGSVVTSVGTIDSVTPSANGGAISASSLIFQSASGTVPGLVNTGTQSFAGDKTFSGVTAFGSGSRITTIDATGRVTVLYNDNAIASALSLNNTGITGTNQGIRVDFGLNAASAPAVPGARIEALTDADYSVSGNQTSHLAFSVRNAGTLTSRMILAADGTLTLGAYGTGLLHSGAGGALTSSLLVNADITAGTIAASKLVGSDIATVGTITSGTWSGTIISKAKGGSGADNSSLTFPSTGTLATLNGVEVFGNKSFHDAPVPDTNYAIGAGVDIGTASFVWKDLYLGHQFVYSAVQPTAVGTTPATAADAFWSGSFTTGGNTTIATTGVGGTGQVLSTTAGTGGQATAATTSATGGAGGANSLTGGAGGATLVSSATASFGGAGGASSKTGGAGGAASSTTGTNGGGAGGASDNTGGAGGPANGASSGLGTGGNGGFGRARGGPGGNASAGTGSLAGGVGGQGQVAAGAGGSAIGTGTGTATGGQSGAVNILGAAGGAATGAITGSNVGGLSNDINITGGAGGAASGASVANTSGGGANVIVTAGPAGVASGTGAVQGSSGYVAFKTGSSSTERHRIQADGTQLLGAVTASTVPSNSTSQMGFYQTGTKFVTWYNDAGTVRYKYLDMSGTGVTWVATTTAP